MRAPRVEQRGMDVDPHRGMLFPEIVGQLESVATATRASSHFLRWHRSFEQPDLALYASSSRSAAFAAALGREASTLRQRPRPLARRSLLVAVDTFAIWWRDPARYRGTRKPLLDLTALSTRSRRCSQRGSPPAPCPRRRQRTRLSAFGPPPTTTPLHCARIPLSRTSQRLSTPLDRSTCNGTFSFGYAVWKGEALTGAAAMSTQPC